MEQRKETLHVFAADGNDLACRQCQRGRLDPPDIHDVDDIAFAALTQKAIGQQPRIIAQASASLDDAFGERHPDVRLTVTKSLPANSTRALMNALQKRSFKYDVFVISSGTSRTVLWRRPMSSSSFWMSRS